MGKGIILTADELNKFRDVLGGVELYRKYVERYYFCTMTGKDNSA